MGYCGLRAAIQMRGRRSRQREMCRRWNSGQRAESVALFCPVDIVSGITPLHGIILSRFSAIAVIFYTFPFLSDCMSMNSLI